MLVEMMEAKAQVTKVTDKYVYTTETQVWRRVNWHVVGDSYKTDLGTLKPHWMDCAAYSTEAEAAAMIHEVARRWNHDEVHCHVISYEDVEYITKHHRNKVRG